MERFGVSPREIAIDTIATINDRNMESVFEKVRESASGGEPMRITGRVFLFTVMTAALLSCASGPSQKASRPSVEDSLPPDTPAAEGQSQPADAALGLPSAPQNARRS